MLTGVVDDLVERKIAEVAQAVSISAAKHNINVDIAISGSDNFAIDAARRLVAMRAVVFDGFGNRFDFVGTQKLLKAFVFAEDFGGNFFMVSGIDVMAEIMIGGGSIDDVGVERLGGFYGLSFSGLIGLHGLIGCVDLISCVGLIGCVDLISEFETATDDVVDMADLMTPLVFGILRKNAGFDVGFQLGIDF